MLPMAVGLGEAGSQTAPLGRAVIGGLTGGTIATLIILPAIFTLLQGEHTRKSASLLPANRGGSALPAVPHLTTFVHISSRPCENPTFGQKRARSERFSAISELLIVQNRRNFRKNLE